MKLRNPFISHFEISFKLAHTLIIMTCKMNDKTIKKYKLIRTYNDIDLIWGVIDKINNNQNNIIFEINNIDNDTIVFDFKCKSNYNNDVIKLF